jgi:predicted RNA-binding Zn-ribbon protein involved in translation (DUF1610 family)
LGFSFLKGGNMKKSFQKVSLRCPECGYEENREVEIGESLEGTICPNCGEGEMSETILDNKEEEIV